MLKVIPIKIFSRLLLMVILLLAVDGACQNSRTKVANPAELSCQALLTDAGSSSDCPGTPGNHSDDPGRCDDCDDCDDCDGCGCGASFFSHLFRYVYHPVTTELTFLDYIWYIPEVYPLKFNPPPNHA